MLQIYPEKHLVGRDRPPRVAARSFRREVNQCSVVQGALRVRGLEMSVRGGLAQSSAEE